MIAARIDEWWGRSLGLAIVFSSTLGAQEARPAELRSWMMRQLPAAPVALSGDVTNCTLVRCNQTASLFASMPAPLGFDFTSGLRVSDVAAERPFGFSTSRIFGSAYLSRDFGPVGVWSGATTGHARLNDGVTADPLPGVESGVSLRWRRIGFAVSAAGGHVLMPAVKGQRSSPIIRLISDSLGLRADTIYPPQADSAGTSDNRWSSTEARVTWRQDRWWVAARGGRLASTRQSSGFWAGVQAGAELPHGVSLLLGAGKSSRSLTYTGAGSAAPHVSVGFAFNTAVLSHREARADSTEASSPSSRPLTISDLGDGRWLLGFSAARLADGGGVTEMPHTIEIACDCDGWAPRAMRRMGDRWVAEVRARSGMHRVSIRIDGGAWIAPPGLASIDDDFAGHAGLLVVP